MLDLYSWEKLYYTPSGTFGMCMSSYCTSVLVDIHEDCDTLLQMMWEAENLVLLDSILLKLYQETFWVKVHPMFPLSYCCREEIELFSPALITSSCSFPPSLNICPKFWRSLEFCNFFNIIPLPKPWRRDVESQPINAWTKKDFQ